MDIILDCALGRWSPVIGDPTPAGWITVVAYGVAAVLALALAAGRASGRDAGAERLFWTLAAGYLAFLAVNKQLDLQSLLTAVGRCTARLQGWYGERRAVQAGMILALVGASLGAGLIAMWVFRRTLGRTGPAILGLMAITTYVLVRAVGFHHMDRLIGTRLPGGLKVNWVFELGAIALFLFGAGWAMAMRRARRRV